MFVPHHCPHCGGYECNPACTDPGRAAAILERLVRRGVQADDLGFLLDPSRLVEMEEVLRRMPQRFQPGGRALLVPVLRSRGELRIEDDPDHQQWIDALVEACGGCEHRMPCEGCQQGAGCDGPCPSCQERDRLGYHHGEYGDEDDHEEDWA